MHCKPHGLINLFLFLYQYNHLIMKVIGVMSGSSLDGLDIATVSFAEHTLSWQLEKAASIPPPETLKQSLKLSASATAQNLAHTEYNFSDFVARALQQYISENGPADLIGIHGHTVLHLPDIQTSWQLLNGGHIAAKTEHTVVCDFRNSDMALGGQGTPMAVIADRDLFPDYDLYVNLGGIANISFKENNLWTSYDLCPCNQVLNYYSNILGKPYDENGSLAQTGKVHHVLLNKLLEDAYIVAPPPKSIDNSWIKDYWIKKMDAYNLSAQDLLRTSVAYISQSIVNCISQKKTRVFITGGGAYNRFLISEIEKKSQNMDAEIVLPDDNIINNKEAILIAYCAYLRHKRKHNFIPSASGASRAVSGGAIYIP